MRRVVIAGMIGNGLEWYDFALYGYFAPVIGKLFFPLTDAYAQLIASYGVFAAGFVMRPIGAIFFGYIGDKFGRRFSLTLSIVMMAIPTVCIGFLPSYAAIGIAAPILLTLVRLVQGLSLAGQFSGAIAFVVEHAPAGRRGLAGSSTIMSLCAGMLLGSFVATVFAESLSAAAFESWGWRIPFILGAGIAYVGFYIRHNTEESPHYVKAKEEGTLSSTPVREALRSYWLAMLRGIGIYMSVTVPFYILTVFMNGFVSKILGHPMKDALLISTLCMIVLMVLAPVTGHLSDKWGRKRLLAATAIAYLVAAYPLFMLLVQPGFGSILFAELMFAVIVAFFIGPAPAIFVELFPTSVRYTGMALSYNVCAALFGGTAPMVATWLIQATHLNTVVAFYIMFCAICSLAALLGYKDIYRQQLE